MVGEVIKLWAGHLRNHGLIPGRCKRLLASKTPSMVLNLHPAPSGEPYISQLPISVYHLSFHRD